MAMKVKVIEKNRCIMGDFSTDDLLKDKIYNILEVEDGLGWYRIIDESGEDYCYPPELFEIVEED